MEALIKEIHTAVIEGQSALVQEKVNAALAAGVDATVILNDGMISAMAEVGQLFQEGECFVPEMLIAARRALRRRGRASRDGVDQTLPAGSRSQISRQNCHRNC